MAVPVGLIVGLASNLLGGKKSEQQAAPPPAVEPATVTANTQDVKVASPANPEGGSDSVALSEPAQEELAGGEA